MVEFALISRRSALNAGTRFNVRGTDDKGNAANFVETEQILAYLDFRCSYVQVKILVIFNHSIYNQTKTNKYLKVRGSIPIYWSQKANLKYKPSIKVEESKNNVNNFIF